MKTCILLVTQSESLTKVLKYQYIIDWLSISAVRADDDGDATVEADIGKSRDGSRTDDEVVER